MPAVLAKLVERRLGEVALRRMGEELVIVLQGPRAVGKSTLLRKLAVSRGREVIDLDELDTRDAVRADPAQFARGEPPVLIDEFQHVPDLLDATVPDAPVGSFELNLPEGPYSALTTDGNLCTQKLTMPTEFLAQNGATLRQNTRIAVTGCAKKVRHERKKHHHRKTKKK